MKKMNGQEMLDWVHEHPFYDGKDMSWNGMSAAFLVRMLDVKPYPTAHAALDDTVIEGHFPDTAPAGAFHWFRNEAYGYNAVDTIGGGFQILTTGEWIPDQLGRGIGVTSVGAMEARGNKYVGWSKGYGHNGG